MALARIFEELGGQKFGADGRRRPSHDAQPGSGRLSGFEDADVLSEILAETDKTSDIPDSLQQFYRKRILRVSGVQFLSRLASDLIINAFDTPWSPHNDLGKSWKSYLTFFWKPFLQYVIFPAQFAFLYSYHPTGNMGDLPTKLAEEWRKKHLVEAEEAFEKVEREGRTSAGPSFFKKAEATEEEKEPVAV